MDIREYRVTVTSVKAASHTRKWLVFHVIDITNFVETAHDSAKQMANGLVNNPLVSQVSMCITARKVI